MAKTILTVALTLCLAALATAQLLSGAYDFQGNYHDATTGQISSSLTGRVYNTRLPLAAALAYAPAAYAPAAYAPAAYAPAAYAYGAPLTYSAPLLLK